MMGRPTAKFPVVTSPLTYVGHDAVQRDIANVKAAMLAAGVREGFLNSVAPGSCARFADATTTTRRRSSAPAPTAMREEYTAIVESGLILQLDDPCIAENWDQINPEPSVADYQRYAMLRVEALNEAIRGLPADRIRFHLCWGSWHGPHVTDIPMRDIVDVMLQINAGAYMFEAGNVRHEHEWKVWRDVKLPAARSSCRASSATRRTSSSTPRSWPTASSATPRAWGARTSSRPPTAASAAGCTRRSPGRSWSRWWRARGWPPQHLWS
jgi:5-methyltetrahydropteroyltriglutamate--homocysteine methyltransferase